MEKKKERSKFEMTCLVLIVVLAMAMFTYYLTMIRPKQSDKVKNLIDQVDEREREIMEIPQEKHHEE